jgi:peroxiredoxin
VKKLEARPFALIGVNVVRHTPAELKAVMEKEKLTWRSFASQGDTVNKWRISATPTFYVIDAKGVIRHKWAGSPGEKAIDAALEELIREAERNDAPLPSPVSPRSG